MSTNITITPENGKPQVWKGTLAQIVLCLMEEAEALMARKAKGQILIQFDYASGSLVFKNTRITEYREEK